jgi:hypothetical protein
LKPHFVQNAVKSTAANPRSRGAKPLLNGGYSKFHQSAARTLQFGRSSGFCSLRNGDNNEASMSKVTTVAACVGTIALTCAAILPARAADMPPHYPPQYGAPQYGAPQYGAPPVAEGYVEERYVYTEPAPAYRPPAYVPVAPPVVAYEPAPPAVVAVPEPEPYYVPQRRVYVDPGYGYVEPGYRGPGPYYAGYRYQRGWDNGYRRW